MRKLGPTKMRYLGIGLIVLGVFAALRLWWLLPAVILGGVGTFLYIERRREGRIAAAVQSGLWLLGMGALFLLQFIVPGILILAGASLLIRGREHEVDHKVSAWLTRMGVQLDAPYNIPTTYSANIPMPTVQPPSINPAPNPGATVPEPAPNTGETTRL